MKAVYIGAYGAPEVLQVKEIAKPMIQANQILVRIHATAVNSGDVRIRKADPFAMRFFAGFFKPNITILGGVFSGIVEEVGTAVTKYKVGDAVFGSTDMKFGAYATYIAVEASSSIYFKPNNISHEEAASIPFGASTAIYFLNKAEIKKGQEVLIYGASGAVGSAAIQVATILGAKVTAVCSSANIGLVRSLGAYQVIDYTKEELSSTNKKYDVIMDCVNKLPVKKAVSMLTDKGQLILSAAGLSEMIMGSLCTLSSDKKMQVGVTSQTTETIQQLSTWIEEGNYQAVIDKKYNLDEIVEAHRYVDKGHKKGNVVIRVE